MTHPDTERIEDYVEGALAPATHRAVEAHLRVCAMCAEEALTVRRLLDGLAALPRGIAPDRDLLPGIAAAIEGSVAVDPERVRLDVDPMRPKRGHVAASNTPRGRRAVQIIKARLRFRGTLPTRGALAAAIVFIGLGIALTAVLRRGHETGAGVPSSAASFDLVAFGDVEAKYEAAAGDLAVVLDERRAELPPATARVVEQNLAVLDAALTEARAALASDPHDAALSRILLATWEKRLDLLRWAADL